MFQFNIKNTFEKDMKISVTTTFTKRFQSNSKYL